MNKHITLLTEQADAYARSDNSSMLFENWKSRYDQKLVELIVQEHLGILQKEWYRLNDLPAGYDDESIAEIRFRAGKKSEINVLTAMIRDHFGLV